MKELIVLLLAATAIAASPAAQAPTFQPEADALVTESSPTRNSGASTTLRVRSMPGESFRTWMRFTLPSVSQPVDSVTLRLYCTDGSPNGGELYVRQDARWTENGITWEDQPRLPERPATTLGPVAPGTWVEVDLTSSVGGPGTYVLALAGGSSNSAYYASRESGQSPEIVLTVSGGSSGPRADFSALPVAGQAPLQVVFTDRSTPGATSWLWSFGDGGTSQLRNPVHLYATPGTYAVTLLASGPAGTASTTKDGFVRVLSGEARGLWTSAVELAQRPMTGAAWNSLLAEANRATGTPVVSNQDDETDQRVLAKALVYARTGNETYRTQVIDACQRAIGTEAGGRTLALGRNLGPYVIAADLVGLPPAVDTPFRAWLRHCLTVSLEGRSLVSTHEERPNNWGTHAGGSRVAVAAYLGDAAELERCARVFKGWLGDRVAYSGFDWGDLTWQADPSRPVAVNPRGATKDGHSIDGVLPDDQRRTGIGFVWPPPKENYVWEALQGALMQAVILHRAGYDVWNWEDQALLRAARWLHDECGYPASGDDTWMPHVLNHFYAASFPAPVPSRPGKNMGWTDWSHPR